METKNTLTQFFKKDGDFRIKEDYRMNDEKMEINKIEVDSQVKNVVQQIGKTSKNLSLETNLNEEDCIKITFYSLLKKISIKQNVNIEIKEYDKILEGKNLDFDYNHNYFLKHLDFLEKIYSRSIPINHKKILGQFFTPRKIAEFMSLIGLNNNIFKVLDPALGGGIFFSNLNKICSHRLSYTAIEKDPLCLAMAKINLSRLSDLDIKYINIDFLEYEENGYDLIIANPPYIRFHDISDREITISNIEKQINIKLSRLINYYALFFFKAGNLLKEGGKLVFITPSEFLNANYGKSLKEFFKKNFEIEAIITFGNGSLVFEDNLSTACITILTKKGNPDRNKQVRFIRLSKCVDMNILIKLLRASTSNISEEYFSMNVIKQGELNYKEKWMKCFENNEKFESTKKNLVKLSNIASVNRGIATGANNFFLFSKSKIKKWDIEKKFLKCVIAKSNFCEYNDFTEEDFDNLIRLDKPSHLLYCFSTPSYNLNKFISFGEKEGYQNRYLTSKRNVWYSMEKRKIAPIWAGVFSRDVVKFILNRTNCLNLTTFHGIYPKFSNEDTLLFLVAYLNSEHCKELMKRELRFYGGGLNKFEPKDLENIPVPNLEKIQKEKIKQVASLFSKYLKSSRKGEDTNLLKKEINNHFSEILNS